MRRAGLVALAAGADARHRIVRLTAKARRLMPAIEAEWAATTAAAAQLDAELPYPLSTLVEALHEALRRRPFRERIADAAAAAPNPAVAPFRDVLTTVHKRQ
jgi:DNA-binding MarR family transcriptional regulator